MADKVTTDYKKMGGLVDHKSLSLTSVVVAMRSCAVPSTPAVGTPSLGRRPKPCAGARRRADA